MPGEEACSKLVLKCRKKDILIYRSMNLVPYMCKMRSRRCTLTREASDPVVKLAVD